MHTYPQKNTYTHTYRHRDRHPFVQTHVDTHTLDFRVLCGRLMSRALSALGEVIHTRSPGGLHRVPVLPPIPMSGSPSRGPHHETPPGERYAVLYLFCGPTSCVLAPTAYGVAETYAHVIVSSAFLCTYVCMYVCTYVRMYVCMYTYVCIRGICIHACAYLYMAVY